MLIGALAVSMTDFLTDNPRFADLAAQAGFAGLGTVAGYVASLFALLAIPVGLFATVRIADLAAAESDRRLTLLLAQPVTRSRLLLAELTATAGGMAGVVTVAGLATWAGAGAVGADLGLGAAVAGTWNVLPVALLSCGAAVLALGWAPRVVGPVGAAPVVGGFLIQVVATSTNAPAWVADLSPFNHLAAVPDAAPDWRAAGVMTAIAVAAAVLGGIGYRRRDLTA
jgi:ABC-2 type transport system permease protein